MLIMTLGYKYNKQAARELRKNMTYAEELLWNELRNRKLGGFKFKRQHPISKYIADFYCPEKMLVIEVDGLVHELKEQTELDALRDKVMNDYHIKIIRFKNKEVINNLYYVLKQIRLELKF